MKRVIYMSAVVAMMLMAACSGRSPKDVEQKMADETKKAEMSASEVDSTKTETTDSTMMKTSESTEVKPDTTATK